MGDHRRRQRRGGNGGGGTSSTPTPAGERGNGARQEELQDFQATAEAADRAGANSTLAQVAREVDEAHPEGPEVREGALGTRNRGAIRVRPDSAEARVHREHYNRDGSTRSSVDGGVRVRENDVRVSVNGSSGSGEGRRGGGVAGSLQTGRGRSGGSLSGSMNLGRNTVSVGGGHTVIVDAPEAQDDGSYQVSGTITDSVEGGSSLNLGTTLGLSGEHEDVRTFTETFTGPHAREQAFAFYQNPEGAEAAAALPASFDEVFDLDLGEARGEQSAWEGGGTASGDVGGVGLSAGLERGETEGLSMERTGANTLRFTLSYEDTTNGEAGLSAGGTGMGYAAGREVRRCTTWELDLYADGAREAYAQLRQRHPLRGEAGPGWTRVSDQLAVVDSSGMTAELFGIDLDGAESVEESVRSDARGVRRSTTWNTDDPGVSTTAFARTRTTLRDGVAPQDDDNGYTVTNMVRRDNLDLSQEALADASNGMDGQATGEGEGHWTVDSSYSEAQIENFGMAAVESTTPPGTLPPRLHGDWAALQERLRANPDDSAAIGEFLQVAGVDGTRVLQGLTGGPVDQHVQLDTDAGTDANFPGREANQGTDAAVQGLVDRYQQAAQRPMDGAGPDSVVGIGAEARQLRRQLRNRLDAITTRGAYPDLPATLVNTEARRIEGWIRSLSILVRAGNRAEQPEDDGNRSMDWAGEPRNAEAAAQVAEVTGQSAEEVAQQDADTIHMNLMMQLVTDFEALGDRKRDAHYLWEQHHSHHGSSDTPAERFTGGMVWVTGNAMNDGYSTMRTRLAGADAQFTVAEERYLRTCDRFDPAVLSHPGSRSAEILQELRNAQGFIRLSRRQYDHVYERLTHMMHQQIGQAPGVWGR